MYVKNFFTFKSSNFKRGNRNLNDETYRKHTHRGIQYDYKDKTNFQHKLSTKSGHRFLLKVLPGRKKLPLPSSRLVWDQKTNTIFCF